MNTSSLADASVEKGFRIRGASMTRLETFADAAFAFAVTLLVISVDDVPSSYQEFQVALKSVPTFLACFAQLIMFWIGHRKWSRLYGLDDIASLWLTVLLIAGVLVLVYPLRVVISLGLGVLTNGWLPFAFAVTAAQTGSLFIFYGLAFAFLSGMILALYFHAWRQRDALALNAVERFDTRTNIRLWTVVCCTGLTSSLIAALFTEQWVGLAGWFYLWLFAVFPWLTRRADKQRAAFFNEAWETERRPPV